MTDLESILVERLNPVEDTLPIEIEKDTTAAVMILLAEQNGAWNIVYTRRTNEVKTHQGEVSFPGGSYESQDKSLAQTALRETMEEIGIEPDCIKLLGGMDPHKTIYDFLVFPFVGILQCASEFTMNPAEVDRVFMIPLNWLMDSNNYYEKDHMIYGQDVRSVLHYHDFLGEHLWGLTARITREILGYMY